jgi:tight adherence protein B
VNVQPKPMRRERAHAPPAIEAVAAVTERLAVLLAAGVPPPSAWAYLGDDTSSPTVRRVAAAAVAGEDISDALARWAADSGGRVPRHSVRHSDGESPGSGAPPARASKPGRLRDTADLPDAWRGLAAAWFVATESGAPLAQSLRGLAASFRALGQTQRDLAVALAGPAATARMVMALPVVGVVFGMGLGFNTLQTLFATLPGLICLAVGGLLMWAGIRWNRRMLRSAAPTDRTPGLAIDLMAVAMTGGGSLERARRLVDEARGRFLENTVGDVEEIQAVLSLAARAGVPAAELLRSEAEARRRDARSAGQQAAAALAVRLMMPLGVCVLPAFMVLGVAPLLLAIVSSTVASM